MPIRDVADARQHTPRLVLSRHVHPPVHGKRDARAEADHETLTAIHRLTVEDHAINEAQTTILEKLQGAAR